MVWTEERHGQLVTLAQRGMTASQVAEELGTTRNAILGRAHRHGIKFLGARPLPPRRWQAASGRPKGSKPPPNHPMRRGRPRGARAFTDQEIATAIAARLAGLSYRKAAAMIGASAISLRQNWMKDASLTVLGRTLYMRAKADAAARAQAAAAQQKARLERIDAWNEGVMRRLPPRLASIAQRRLAGETLQEIGDDLGLTRERVRQLFKKAISAGLHYPREVA